VFSSPAASGGAGTYFNAIAPGNYVAYTVSITEPGTYRVKVGIQTKPNKGVFQMFVDGIKQGLRQDEYSATVGYATRDLGTVTFTSAGDKTFNFTVTGHNPNSTGYTLALDYIELSPTTRQESESLSVAARSAVPYGVFSHELASAGAGTYLNGTAPGDFVTYTVPILAPGAYRVKLGIQSKPNKGIFQLWVDGVKRGQPQDEYASTTTYSVRDLGVLTFTDAGDKAFRFAVTGRNPSSLGYTLAFDYIELIPTDRFETESLPVQAKSSGPHGIYFSPDSSGGAGTYYNATSANNYVTYTVPVVQAGTYHVTVGIHTKPNKGIFQLSIDGVNQGAPQDEYNPLYTYEARDLGTVTFQSPGNKAFNFLITGRNPGSSGYTLAFDYIDLIP
jgi:hypothetical protein